MNNKLFNYDFVCFKNFHKNKNLISLRDLKELSMSYLMDCTLNMLITQVDLLMKLSIFMVQTNINSIYLRKYYMCNKTLKMYFNFDVTCL